MTVEKLRDICNEIKAGATEAHEKVKSGDVPKFEDAARRAATHPNWLHMIEQWFF